MRTVLLGLALASVVAAAADPLFTSADEKLDTLQQGRVKPGSVVVFTPAEVNAWVRVKAPQAVPDGLRNTDVELGTDAVTGSALVDFLKMRHAKGRETNRLMASLLEGERPLRVSVHMLSAGGHATVSLTRVELSGVAASGTVLDFLIQNFFRPLYPEAKINEPFELGDNIERIDIRPTGVRVAVKK